MTPRRIDFVAFANRELGLAETRAYLDVPIGDDERHEVLTLVRWFVRRYPTPLERLAYVRRAYARWQRVIDAD